MKYTTTLPTLKPTVKGFKIILITITMCCFATLTVKAQTSAGPTVDWYNYTWIDHEYKSTTPVAQRYSDYDWWYDHCTAYTNPSTKTGHLGYIACGISKFRCAERSNPTATSLNYSETDPAYGAYANGCAGGSAPLYKTKSCDYDYGNFENTVYGSLGLGFNTIGRINPTGQTDFLMPINYEGEYVRVKQLADGNFMTVGRSLATRKRIDAPQLGAPLYYNPTTANPTNYFINTQIYVAPAPTTPVNISHWDVMKFDPNGVPIFNNLYGYYDFNAGNVTFTTPDPSTGNMTTVSNNFTSPQLCYFAGGACYDFVEDNTGNIAIVGESYDVNTVKFYGTTFHDNFSKPALIKIDANGKVIGKLALSSAGTGIGVASSIEGVARAVTTAVIGGVDCYIVCYNEADQSVSPSQRKMIIQALRADLTGTPLWTKIIQATSATQLQTAVWSVEVKNNKVYFPLLTNCSGCEYSGDNIADLQFVILDVNNGSNISNTFLAPVHAFDLRARITPLSNGDFGVVSTVQKNAWACSSPPPNYIMNNNMQPDYDLYNCNNGQTTNFWNSNTYVARVNPNGTKIWDGAYDSNTPYTCTDYPTSPNSGGGDPKRQECMYGISEAPDGGLVFSGNNSSNVDDNYMLKLKNDCQSTATYDYKPTVETLNVPFSQGISIPQNQAVLITGNVVWNTSKKIKGAVVILGNGTLTINGLNTIIEFADSNYVGYGSGIFINDGGTLKVNDATLTSLQGCGNNSMWQGIVMLSDYTLSQKFGYQPIAQLNNAKLINARHGIVTGIPNSAFTSGSGIVQANNTIFKNNYIDVEFLEVSPIYTYIYNVNGTELSNFYKCTFLGDAVLNDASYKGAQNQRISNAIHVKLNGNIRGLVFKGCVFKTDLTNLFTLNVLNRSIGLKSFSSTFIIQDDCSSIIAGNCVFANASKFENLSNGIIVSTSNVLQNYVVQNTTFNNCLTGINQNAVNYSKVQFNTFNSPNSFTQPGGISCFKIAPPPNVVPFCLARQQYYLNQSDGFKHANNQYISANGVNMLGTVFNNCNGTANYSYHNAYNTMLRGQQLQAGNSNLQLKCNTNSNTQAYDVSVTSGAVSQQGSCGNQLAPANNLLSHKGTPESDIRSVSNFQYSYKNNPSSGFQVPLYTSAPVIILPCNAGNAGIYNYTQDCPVEQNPGCGAGCRLATINNISPAINQNNNLLRAGAASSLITVINSQMGGQVQSVLLNRSPYLSDQVLLAFLNKGFANGITKNVVQANQPVTASVWQAVIASNLPNGIYNQLLAGQAGTSPRVLLEQATQQLVFDKQNQINQALVDVLNPADTTNPYPQAESFMKLDNTGAYYDDLAQLYLRNRQFENAQDYIDSLAKQASNNQLVGYLNLAKIATQTNNWAAVLKNPSNRSFITELAHNTTAIGSGLAQSIADYYLTPGLYDIIEDFAPANGSRLFASNTIETDKTEVFNNGAVNVYPNPFTNQLTVTYDFENGEPKGVIQLIEVGSGRIIYETAFNNLNGIHIINGTQIVNGFYILKIQQQNTKPIYFKVINSN